MYCPNCGAANDAGARFCANCGTTLGSSPPAEPTPIPYQQPPAQYQQPPAQYQQPPAQYQQPPAQYQQPPAQYQQPPVYQPQPPMGGGNSVAKNIGIGCLIAIAIVFFVGLSCTRACFGLRRGSHILRHI